MLISEYLGLDDDLKNLGVFDARLDRDSHFFINIVKLKYSTTPEFKEAYEHVNERFSEIATLLGAAKSPSKSDKLFRAAWDKFDFSEVNGINLGFAESTHGAGFGDILSLQVLGDAYQIVETGSKQPEIFHLVGLFEENIGPDRLSDMIASIIKPDIATYTLRILSELGINAKSRPDLRFLGNGLLRHPCKKCELLLLPVEVLHELPIASYWEDVDEVIEKNRAIRREINEEISGMWEKWHSARRKDFLKRHIFMNPDVCARVIEGYRNEEPPVFDPGTDAEYFSEVLFGEIKKSASFDASDGGKGSLEGALEIIGYFKDWVENNHGWGLIRESQSNKREKAIQRCIHLCAKYYVWHNDLDISFEPDAGRGPVDLKLSRGNDKTIVEIKLSSNTRCLHGYRTQVEEYAKGEGTANRVYVIVNLGNPKRIENVVKLHRKNMAAGISCPKLILIDAREKKAASTFEPLEQLDFGDMPSFDYPDIDLDSLGFDFADFDDVALGFQSEVEQEDSSQG